MILDMFREALIPQDAVFHVLVMAFQGLDQIFGGGGGWPELPGPLGLPPAT